jgi:elongation factor G
LKEYQTDGIRNVVLLGHASSGKTSLAEAMLFTAGRSTRLGRVEDGTTTSDYHQDEISRKFSISSSLLNCEWQKNKINILDAPGYLDFIGESKALTRIADLALITVNIQSGIEVGTELVFQYSGEENLPVCFAINMLDKEHANFDKIIGDLKEVFGKNVVPVQIPVNQGVDFDSVIDIISNKLYAYPKDGNGISEKKDIPDNLKSNIDSVREEIIEHVAESNDELLEKFFENGVLTEGELSDGLKSAIANRNFFPVFAVSAYSNIGVSSLLDFITKFAPSPLRASVKGTYKGKEITREVNDSEASSLFIFKTVSEAHIGELSMFKVMSGVVKTGMDLVNVKRNITERIGQIFVVNGKEKQEIAHMYAGDLGAVAKLRDTHTGDTLADPKSPIEYSRVKFPEPVIQIAISPKSRGDEEKISTGLQILADEDPTFSFHYDSELKQTIISGQGELHLTIILERLKQKFNVEVNQLTPRIPYRETITKRGESKYRHKKQTGGAGQFAEVWMYVEPLERGSGVEFENTLTGQNVDRVFVPSVEKGVKSACEEGVLAGYRVTDVKAVFYDGKQHPVDSKDIAFQIAGKGAFKECFMNANPILLEPIYDLEVIVPEEYMGDVMGDISSRRGKILGMSSEGSFQKILAKVPLAELHRYGTALRSMTQGRGLHRQKFSHYEPIPRELQEKVVEESKEKKGEESK